jgi:hypothetical protein
MVDIGVILKQFEKPDEVREMSLGRFEVVHIGGMTIGPHDSWVLGDEPYVSLHFVGAGNYAR